MAMFKSLITKLHGLPAGHYLALNSNSCSHHVRSKTFLLQSNWSLNIASNFCTNKGTNDSSTSESGPISVPENNQTVRAIAFGLDKPGPIQYVNPKYGNLPALPRDDTPVRLGADQDTGYADNVFTSLRLPEQVVRNIPEDVMKVLDLNMASQTEKNKARIQYAIRKYRRHPHDVGSSEVQIAIFTERIDYLQRHMGTHKKDYYTRRRMEMLTAKRRRLLWYLERTIPDRHRDLVKLLGLTETDLKGTKAKPKGREYKQAPRWT